MRNKCRPPKNGDFRSNIIQAIILGPSYFGGTFVTAKNELPLKQALVIYWRVGTRTFNDQYLHGRALNHSKEK